MEKKREKSFEIDNARNLDNISQRHQVLDRIEDALCNNEYKMAFEMFRKNIIKLLHDGGVLKVCSPYYYRNSRLKEDKVAGEMIGVYKYYCASNSSFRSFRPHGNLFRCGKPAATFIQAVKGFLQMLNENYGQDPWEILNSCMGNDYFDLENYLDQAPVYGFSHNRHSRAVAGKVLAGYTEKYYGSMDAVEFIEWYQAMERVYTTYGFPFACTYAGWFFDGYDILYRKVLDEGAWTLRNLWEHGQSDWLVKQLQPYPEIQLTYGSLIEALLKPEYEPLLFRLFPFRLAEDTFKPGCVMDSDEWEEFTLKLAKTLHFAECCNGRKNIAEDMIKDAAKAMCDILKAVRHYMDGENMQ